jgi:hypothetical protein
MMSFAPLKTHSISELIAGIDSISNAIVVSYDDSEFAYYLTRLKSLSTKTVELLI